MLYWYLNLTPQTRCAIPRQPRVWLPLRQSMLTGQESLSLSESALTSCLPSAKQNAPITSLESALTSHFQLVENTCTLTHAESALTDMTPATSLESALTRNRGVGGTGRILLRPRRRHDCKSFTITSFADPARLTLLESHRSKITGVEEESYTEPHQKIDAIFTRIPAISHLIRISML